jgi:micrococcal nuclease
MLKYTPPRKMSGHRRRLRYVRGKVVWVGGLAIVVAALVLADRAGLFGTRPPGDVAKYHNTTTCVARVIDGDTIDVDVPDGRYPHTRIRLLGVDTPETLKPDTPPQHFGKEAAEFTKNACLGKEVRLELDSHRTRDNYARLLAYVHLPDGQMLNRIVLTEGYAYADPRFDHPLKREFRPLQREARRTRTGLWDTVRRSDLPYYYRDLKLPSETGRQERKDGSDTGPPK